MSHKKKTRPAAAASSVATGPERAGAAATLAAGPVDAVEAARTTLAAARYKEAIEQYKVLLKREQHPDWLDGLAQAYAGRAGQLAAKGMFKEALALWRIRSETCSVPLLDGPYLTWLIKTGQAEQALALLPALDKLPAAARDRARAQLAAALLVAPDQRLAGLDDDGRRHRAAARAALTASASGVTGSAADNASPLEAALQAISFRSPYRDLRPLLKAMALQASDPSQAATVLAHVPENGPFEAVAKVLRVCLMPGSEWIYGLRQLDDAGRTLVLELKGCPVPQRPLLLDLMARAGGAGSPGASSSLAPAGPSPPDLLELLQRHRHVIPAGLARKLSLRLLPHAPQRLDPFRVAYGPVAELEEQRVRALAAELKRDPEQAEGHWLRVAELLERPAAAPDGQRRAALVLRRIADRHPQHGVDGALCEHARDWLERSLEHDPADRDTHLRLVRDAHQRGDLKDARRALDAARQRFPEDQPLLQEAVAIALSAGAFKKAASLAKQALQADPLNPRLRAMVGHAYLAQARKQIGALNLPAARRELDDAAEWLSGGSNAAPHGATERGAVELLRAFVSALAAPAGRGAPGAAARSAVPAASAASARPAQPAPSAQPPERGDQGDGGAAQLREAFTRIAAQDGPLVAAFHLLLEAKRVNYQPGAGAGDLLRRAGIDPALVPTAPQVVALAQQLNALPKKDAAMRPAIGALRGMLERAATLHYAERDHLLICEALNRHRQPELTRRFAAAALQRWPHRPVFLYFEALARYGAEPWRMPEHECLRLERAFDQRTASRLGKLLDAASDDDDYPASPNIPETPDDGALRGAIQDLAADGIPDVLETLLAVTGPDRFLDLMRSEIGAATFDALRREFSGSKKQFAQSLIDALAASAPGKSAAEPGRPRAARVPIETNGPTSPKAANSANPANSANSARPPRSPKAAKAPKSPQSADSPGHPPQSSYQPDLFDD